MIKAVIFDMDGLIVDSEPLWREAEKIIFPKVGHNLTDEMCASTMGLRTDEVVQHWYDLRPWSNKTQKEVEDEIVTMVEALIVEKGEAMEGVYEALEFFKKKDLKIALASSSMMRLIETVVQKLKIKDKFQVIRSAEFEEYGKPHPSIFIKTAKDLDVKPTDCMVLEDSFNGLVAAKAARMTAVAVPDPHFGNQTKFVIADLKLNSLKEFNEEYWQKLNKDVKKQGAISKDTTP